jgi:hypothetical protein
MVISAIGRMAAKAAIKKISNASAKKAQAFMRADKKKTDIMKQGLPMSAITMAEGSGRASGLFKNMKKMISVMPAAAGEKALVGASKFVQRALKFSSPTPKSFFSKKKGGGMATRGMGAALKKGGMSKGKKYI